MTLYQPGILPPVPNHGRHLEFGLLSGASSTAVLHYLQSLEIDENVVVGLGPNLTGRVDGMRAFQSLSGPDCFVPSTQSDLWCWVRGDDRGEIALRARSISTDLSSLLRCDRIVDGFRYNRGLDLTGYEDGTENPEGQKAIETAIVNGIGVPYDGSSFVTTQQWVHDLDHFGTYSQVDADNIIGRRLSDNMELSDAPASAHVKRTAQESFEPEAFIVRRSMPWATGGDLGLYFTAFGTSLSAFEAQMRRMVGLDDCVVDGLFQFSRPISGSHFWCPPIKGGRLNLTALQIS